MEQGLIHTRDLYTIRRGEWAHDPITGVLAQASGDIIKIKGRSGARACRFLDEAPPTCRIHAERPLECRTLTCWNTAGIERVYAIGRLTREDLISGIAGLWELVSEHQQRCEVERIRRLRMTADGPRVGRLARELACKPAYPLTRTDIGFARQWQHTAREIYTCKVNQEGRDV